MTSPAAKPDLGVLVVDDDFMVASIHTRFVERVPGFVPVGVAATGRAALEEIARLRPDLVLLDVHLPDFSGLEVLRRLRGAGDATGVIMVTAAREADTVRAAAAAGAAHYLVKPFEREDLEARLDAFRRSHEALAAIGRDDANRSVQDTIDQVFVQGGAARAQLPKGLSQETATAVLGALSTEEELSASEVADRIGVSRVSARRYLEHFVEAGRAVGRLQYGGAGRPQRLYRAAGS
ncbi:response regulator [Nocardioides zeae]|uniref:Transcriptional regulatory protein n=1 Tax=Nocardioides imazamoxiresistens TaxID=3231893 RepID=A0ABU3PQN5_9ACTN|nr:response regulator [Nocardioides zeae]MDT9591545.1 response regulator [Nocardioides zeae]